MTKLGKSLRALNNALCYEPYRNALSVALRGEATRFLHLCNLVPGFEGIWEEYCKSIDGKDRHCTLGATLPSGFLFKSNHCRAYIIEKWHCSDEKMAVYHLHSLIQEWIDMQAAPAARMEDSI